jgi:selenocysteine-specific elongation factor
MEKGTPQDVLLGILEQAEPCEFARLLDRSNLAKDEVMMALGALAAEGRVVILGGLRPNAVLFSAQGWKRLEERTRQTLQDHHKQYPLRSGIPKEELKSRLRLPAPVLHEALQRLVQEGVLVEGETTVRLPSHQVQLSQAQEAEVAAFLRSLEEEPHSPPSDRFPELEVLNMLIEQDKVVRVADNIVFSATAYETMVRRITEHIKSQGKITVAEVRDLFTTSRKYALALMEYLDQQRITRRVGDERVLR